MKRISDKKLANLGGKMPWSSIPSHPKRIRKRPRSKSERERIYGPKGYVEWIHGEPCIACGVGRYSQCAHIQTGGTGRKDDWTRTIPLCGPRAVFFDQSQTLYAGCHWILDNKGVDALGKLYGPLDLNALAAATQNLWRAWQESQR